MRQLTRYFSPLATALILGLSPMGAQAQGLFSPVIVVDEQVITGYELQQRIEMMKVVGAPGDPERLAREQLINDRLQLQAARDAGIVVSEQDIADGMSEFAGRAGLDTEQFIKAIGQRGVAAETFRDFVHAGVAWRQLVGQRFASRTSVSEAEVDRALSAQGGGSSVRVLMSEIIIPMPPGQEKAVQDRAKRIATLETTGAFSAEARRHSATATRGNGGRLPWRDLEEFPPGLRPIILGLKPGEVTDPLPLDGAVALFQLRDIEETGYKAPEVAAVDYAAYYMPGGRSPETLAKARVLKSKVDRCDDLYGIAKGQPAEVLDRGTLPPADIPTDIAHELSKLDPGEVSTALTRAGGQTLVFLMLCGRTNQISEDAPDRDQITLGLRNQRITSQAEGYLEQLRADARIIEK